MGQMTWTSKTTARVNVKSVTSPSDSYSFEGMNAADGSFSYSLDPDDMAHAINDILDIGGLSATAVGATRTIKQEGVE